MPSVVYLDGEAGVVAGMWIPFYDTEPLTDEGRIGFTFDGKEIPSPPTEVPVLWPLASKESQVRIRVFWGEIDGLDQDTVVRQSVPLTVDRVRFASWSLDSGWTTPATLVERPKGLRMWSEGVAVADGGNGVTYLLVSGTNRLEDDLFFLRVRGKEVFRFDLPADGTGFAAMAANREDVAVLYTVPDFSRNPPVARALLTVSADGGETWSGTRGVQENSTGSVQSVGVALGPDGIVHAVWSEDPDGGTDDRVLYHAHTADSGMTWNGRSESEIPRGGVNNLSVVATSDGSAHAVFTVGVSGKLMRVSWGQEARTVEIDPVPDLFVSEVSLTTDRFGDGLSAIVSAFPRSAVPPSGGIPKELPLTHFYCVPREIRSFLP